MKNLKKIRCKIWIIALLTILVGTSSNQNAADWWEKIKINGDFQKKTDLSNFCHIGVSGPRGDRDKLRPIKGH